MKKVPTATATREKINFTSIQFHGKNTAVFQRSGNYKANGKVISRIKKVRLIFSKNGV